MLADGAVNDRLSARDRVSSLLQRIVVVLRRHWVAVLACGVTVAIRLPLVLLIHAQPASDSFFYVSTAASLVHGHGYSILGHPTAFFPVGWPAFLAALFAVTGVSFFAVMIANVVLWTVTTALMYAFGYRLGGRAVGAVAAFIIALDPTLIPYVLRAASENLAVPLILGMCLVLQRRGPGGPTLRAGAAAGLLIGLAILVRSTAAPVPFVVALWLLLAHRRRSVVLPAAVLVVAAMLVIAPWAVRNRVVMGAWVLSTNGGYTMWTGNNPKATGGEGGPAFGPWPIASARQEVRVNSVTTRDSLQFIRHDFGRWVGLIPAKARYLLTWKPGEFEDAFTRQPGNDPRAHAVPRPLDSAERAIRKALSDDLGLIGHYLRVFWILGAVGTVLAIARRRPGAGLVALLVLLWIAFHVTLIHGQPRYMVSVYPLLAAPVAWLLTLPFERSRGTSPQG